MEFRAARRSERDEVLDLLALWYGDREFFARYNQNDPKFRDELCLIARDRGALVGTVQIFDRTINLGGACTPMGGIGSVFTRDDYRHKRVASALMQLAVETLVRESFEVSLLFAERLTFYNQFGWREVPRKFTIVSNAASLRPPLNFEMDVFDRERDFAAVADIHREYSSLFNVTAVRDEQDWRGNLIFAGNQPEHPGTGSDEYFVLVRDAGTIVAYARVTQFHGVAMIMEFGCRNSAYDAVVALFRHLGELADGKGSPFKLRGDHRRSDLLRSAKNAAAPPGMLLTHTAHDKNLEQHLTQAGLAIVYHEDRNYMWRILSPQRLASRLAGPVDSVEARAFDIFSDDRSLFWTSDRF